MPKHHRRVCRLGSSPSTEGETDLSGVRPSFWSPTYEAGRLWLAVSFIYEPKETGNDDSTPPGSPEADTAAVGEEGKGIFNLHRATDEILAYGSQTDSPRPWASH